jgi:hypothetical protein
MEQNALNKNGKQRQNFRNGRGGQSTALFRIQLLVGFSCALFSAKANMDLTAALLLVAPVAISSRHVSKSLEQRAKMFPVGVRAFGNKKL